MAIITGGTTSGGGLGTVTTVTSPNTSIVVATPTTTPALTVGSVDKLHTNNPPSAACAMNSQKFTGLAAGTAAGDSIRFEQVSVTWASFTPSTTGITGESATAFFAQVGNLVYIAYNSSGTGSTTARTFTLPVSAGPNGSAYGGMLYFVRDAGSTLTSPGVFTLANNSTTCTLFKTMAQGAGSWTASGAWLVNAVFFYGTN